MSRSAVDPLPSWNDGAAKQAILDFVRSVTTEGGPEFVPEPARIATFDNDGTLWCERPVQFEFFFAMDRLADLARQNPALREQQPFQAFLEKDLKTLSGFGKRALYEFAFATHAGVTPEAFAQVARAWLDTAKHPQLGRLYKQCVYQPQLELLDTLRANGFKTFIVSGGGVEFIRAYAEQVYGVPPEQVIGSSVKTRLEVQNGEVSLVKLSELNSYDDREVKPQNIQLHVGRRPILAFGNSDGDLAMLRYTRAGEGRRLALLLHHTDAEREFAYDRDFRLSPLAEALDRAGDYGFTVVSMKQEWRTVFPPAE